MNMDIFYRKDTLYVHLYEDMDEDDVLFLEKRIEDIMERYEIEKLVVNSCEGECKHLDSFARRYNQKHRVKMILK